MYESRRNRLEGLLGIGLVLCGLVPLGYFVWSYGLSLAPAAAGVSDTETSVLPSPTPVPIELWDAYEQAQAVAQAQAEDAQLASVATQWQATSEEALLDGASNWRFTFYSPASCHELDVAVSAGKASVVNQTRVWDAPVVLAEGNWQQGPEDALLVFLAYGGRALLAEHPGAVVSLHLANNEDRRPVWFLVALSAGEQDPLSVVVDADTMQVLSATP